MIRAHFRFPISLYYNVYEKREPLIESWKEISGNLTDHFVAPRLWNRGEIKKVTCFRHQWALAKSSWWRAIMRRRNELETFVRKWRRMTRTRDTSSWAHELDEWLWRFHSHQSRFRKAKSPSTDELCRFIKRTRQSKNIPPSSTKASSASWSSKYQSNQVEQKRDYSFPTPRSRRHDIGFSLFRQLRLLEWLSWKFAHPPMDVPTNELCKQTRDVLRESSMESVNKSDREKQLIGHNCCGCWSHHKNIRGNVKLAANYQSRANFTLAKIADIAHKSLNNIFFICAKMAESLALFRNDQSSSSLRRIDFSSTFEMHKTISLLRHVTVFS